MTISVVHALCGGRRGSLPYSAPNNPWRPGSRTRVSMVANSGSVTVTDSSGARTHDPTIVNVLVPVVPTIQLTGNDTICSGGSTTLTASLGGIPVPPGGASYSWSPGGQTTSSITATQAGCYTVTVTAFGCSAASAPTCIVVGNAPVQTISVRGNDPTCT